jgi:hypothetical protein
MLARTVSACERHSALLVGGNPMTVLLAIKIIIIAAEIAVVLYEILH